MSKHIQVTGADQGAFYEDLGVAAPDNKAEDIAENYAWESAIWEWAVRKKGNGVKMNEYVTQYGYGENIFLITQYFINSYLSKDFYTEFNSDLSEIRKGTAEYSYDLEEDWKDYKGKEYTGVLHVNDRSYRLSLNYGDRLEKYDKAVQCFLEEDE